jgi:hypothetical protein
MRTLLTDGKFSKSESFKVEDNENGNQNWICGKS